MVPQPFKGAACPPTTRMGLQLGYQEDLAEVERKDGLVAAPSHQPLRHLQNQRNKGPYGDRGASLFYT